MSLVLDEHRQYLTDSARLTAFRRAVEEVVRPGHVVVDLGAGTGVLGSFACQAGAARVYSLEATSLIGVARQISRANGLADRVTFLKKYSLWADLPERADVVLADQIGRFGFEAGVFEFFADARRRFLKPGGVMIPSRIDFVAAPVETAAMWERIQFWDTMPAGLDVRPGRVIARNTGYPIAFSPVDLLGAPAVLASLDPSVSNATPIRMQATLTMRRTGTLHGIGAWFNAQLSPHVSMSNSPSSPNRIKRRNVFLPVEEPVPVVEGDRIDMKLQVVTSEVMVRWEVAVRDCDGNLKASSRHSTFEGMLVCKEDLAHTRPDFSPELTPRGKARLTVLSLCDGRRLLADVEDETYRRHHDLFTRSADAAMFVAEVVTRYAT